jgi:hypothetical protein
MGNALALSGSHPVFTLSLGMFSPTIPSVSGIRKVRKFFLKSQYEMLKLRIQCRRYDSNYSSCTGRSIDNTWSSSVGAQEKGKTG